MLDIPMVDKPRTFQKKQTRFYVSDDLYQQRMSPSARVALAADMSSAATEIMMDNIRYHHPGISREKLLEKTRRRLYPTGQ